MRWWREALLFSLSAAAARPQAPSSQAQAQPEIVSHEAPASFSSRINLVSVPVVVRDRDGRALGGLRQEDFQLADKGKAQVITKFSIEASAASSKAPTAASAPAPATGQGTAGSAEPQKPVLPSRYIAYLFDDINTKPGDLLQGRQAANRQLERTLDPNTRAGIFTTSGRTTQDFTSDAAKLHAAINRIQPWSRGPDSQQDCPLISYYMADVLINKEQSLSPGRGDSQVGSGSQNFLAVLAETLACVRR
jgi:VWFA-related protein